MTTTYGEQRTDEEKAADAEVLARVKAGIMKLERMYGPEWVDKIDSLDYLRMENGRCCVLGKVYGSYSSGKLTLGVDDDGAVKLGFCAPHWMQGSRSSHTAQEYIELNKVWKQELRKLGVQ